MKEQEKKLKELIKPLEYLKKITTEQEMRDYIKSNNFVSNAYVLSILEKILNIKFIVFLSDSIKENDTSSVIYCGLFDDTVTNFKPEFYIMLEYSKQINKYELVAYKNKVIFKFREIPYDLKSMIITKCAEEVGSTFTAIPEFKSYELVGGKANSIIYHDDRKDDGVIILLYCPSSKNKFPGDIKGEKMPTENIKKYIQLSNYENWRCILDNNWSGYDLDETGNTKEYQFIGGDDFEAQDYIEDLDNTDFWTLTNEDTNDIESESVADINKATDEMINEIREFIKEEYNIGGRYAEKYMTIIWVSYQSIFGIK